MWQKFKRLICLLRLGHSPGVTNWHPEEDNTATYKTYCTFCETLIHQCRRPMSNRLKEKLEGGDIK